MNFDLLLSTLFVVKVFILTVLLFYGIFTLVLFSQVRTMNRIETIPPVATILSFLALLQIGVAFSLFIVALVIL